MKRYINSFYSFGSRKNCHKNRNNPLLFKLIRKMIKWNLIIIEKLYSCLLHIKLSQTYEGNRRETRTSGRWVGTQTGAGVTSTTVKLFGNA